MLIMRSRKRQITEGIELPNQERIRMLREKETNKYLEEYWKWILNGYERKKDKKSISDEQENFSKPSSTAGISLKG